MQQTWKLHGKTQIPYTVTDMQHALSLVTNASFAKSFFEKQVYGHIAPDYKTLLANAGLELLHTEVGKSWIGSPGFREENGLLITSNTIRNTPLYDAGLDVNDIITSVNSKQVSSINDLVQLLALHKPGESLPVRYRHRNQEKQTTIILKENPMLSVSSYELLAMPVNDDMLRFRKQWMGPR
jgi:predicted metalloprotease with PDZ domain